MLEKTIKLGNVEEKILGYLYNQSENLNEVENTIKEISYALEMERKTISRCIRSLLEKRMIISKNMGKFSIYTITKEGREYVEAFNIELLGPKESQINGFKDYDIKLDVKEVRESKDEIELIKNEMEELKESINAEMKSFYGRIGEILALIITAIAMIVFNIQITDHRPIDFTNPKTAFKTIMAIDLPYIILFCICIMVFHFIIGKDYETDNISAKDFFLNLLYKVAPIVVVLFVCYFLILI